MAGGEDVPEFLSCPICMHVLYEPKTMHCGHTACTECWADLLGSGLRHACPVCRAPITAGAGDSVGVNIALRDMIQARFPALIAERRAERAPAPPRPAAERPASAVPDAVHERCARPFPLVSTPAALAFLRVHLALPSHASTRAAVQASWDGDKHIVVALERAQLPGESQARFGVVCKLQDVAIPLPGEDPQAHPVRLFGLVLARVRIAELWSDTAFEPTIAACRVEPFADEAEDVDEALVAEVRALCVRQLERLKSLTAQGEILKMGGEVPPASQPSALSLWAAQFVRVDEARRRTLWRGTSVDERLRAVHARMERSELAMSSALAPPSDSDVLRSPLATLLLFGGLAAAGLAAWYVRAARSSGGARQFGDPIADFLFNFHR